MNIAPHTLYEQNGYSSLMAASENGHVEVVDKLLQHGARVDLQEEVHFICLNYNILHTSCMSSKHFSLHVIVCTHVPCILLQNGWHSLMVASQNGHVEVIDKLLQNGARVDLQKEVHYIHLYYLTHIIYT